MALKIQNLCFSYDNNAVLKDISAELEYGNLVCLMGSNGAGKSTLFKCILGNDLNYKGNIFIDNKNINDMKISELSSKVAYIPQSHTMVYNYSVFDTVLMGTASSFSVWNTPKKEQRLSVEKALLQVGISNLCDRNFRNLSGGEQQMVLIARALAQNAKILLMDEPCSNLDYGNQIRVMSLVKKLASQGYLIILSTHNPDHALRFSDSVLVISDGKVEALGLPHKALNKTILKKIYGIDIDLYKLEQTGTTICVPVTD